MPLRAITTASGTGTACTTTVPAGAVVGDVAVLIVANAAYTISSDMSSNGWTLQGASASNAPGGELTVWTKTVTAPDIGATVAVTISTSTRWAMAVMVRYDVSGLDATPVFSSSAALTTTPTAPSITTATANAELVCIYGTEPYVTGVVATYTLPVGQTKIAEISSSSGSQRNASFAIGEEVLSVAGASGTRQATASTPDVNDNVYQGTATLAFTSSAAPEPDPLTVKVRQSGAWVDKPLRIRVGGNWV